LKVTLTFSFYSQIIIFLGFKLKTLSLD